MSEWLRCTLSFLLVAGAITAMVTGGPISCSLPQWQEVDPPGSVMVGGAAV